jgi:hypothetical protein
MRDGVEGGPHWKKGCCGSANVHPPPGFIGVALRGTDTSRRTESDLGRASWSVEPQRGSVLQPTGAEPWASAPLGFACPPPHHVPGPPRGPVMGDTTPQGRSSNGHVQRQMKLAPCEPKHTIGRMTATLTTPVEALLREQVANGHFQSIDLALETAVQTVFGRRASPALESLLDEALSHSGERIPLSQLRRKMA